MRFEFRPDFPQPLLPDVQVHLSGPMLLFAYRHQVHQIFAPLNSSLTHTNVLTP